MKKEDILAASRKEHKHQDLAELETIRYAGTWAATAGAIACSVIIVLVSVLTNTMLYSPWFIYFTMMGTNWLVRAIRMQKKSDWVVGILCLLLAILALIGCIARLWEVGI